MISCGHCKGVHANVNGVWLCAQMEYQAIADAEAEAQRVEREAYFDYVDNFVYTDDDGECEHGLSAALCDGPQHYPFDRDELDCVA